MTDPPSKPPRDDSDDQFDDDWDDEWDERRVLGMQPRTALWVIMSVGVAVAVIAIIVVAITSGGGNDSQTQAATDLPTGSLPQSQAPAGEVTCSVISADPNLAGRYTFVPVALDPPNVPLPTLPPARQCTGTADKGNAPDVTALVWPGVAADTYRRQLLNADWTFDEVRGEVSFFSNPSSAYEIAVLEVNNALVAIYDQG